MDQQLEDVKQAPDSEQRVVLTIKDFLFALTNIALAYSLITMVKQSSMGIWITVITWIFCGATLFFAKSKKVKVQKYHYGYLTYIMLLGLSFSLLDNQVLLDVNLLTLLLSMAYWVLALVGARSGNQLNSQLFRDLLRGIFLQPFKKLMTTYAFKDSLTSKNKNLKYVVIGLLISLPVLSVVISLLVSADSMFKTFINGIFYGLSANLVDQLITILFAILIGTYFFLYVSQNMLKEATAKTKAANFKGPNILYLTVLISFISIYLIFFATSIFGYIRFYQEATIRSSISDYAREGFFQLLAVALINVCIFLLIRRLSTSSQPIKIGLTVIGLETLGLVALGLAKMMLYISTFGLTILRFNTSWFMIVLFCCVVVFIISLWKDFNYVRLAILMGAFSLLLISFRNTGNDIAAYNYQKYQQGDMQEFDLYMLYSIGVEAVPTVVKIYQETTDEELKEAATIFLEDMKEELESNPYMITLQRVQSLKLIQKTLR